MEGYVKNISKLWTHSMKRAVGPGAKIPLGELYNQYGEKHGLKEGAEFVEWLRTVKLRDTNRWKIVYSDDEVIEEIIPAEPVVVEKASHVTPLVAEKAEVKDIVMLSVRKAREVVPKVNDLKLLKYSLQEAHQLAGKDSLCIILRKRIKELQLGR